MIERIKPVKRVTDGGNYFTSAKKNIKFISSGCKLFDLALGGGWAENHIANIVGDASTGKTLLCIEAASNFAKKYPKGMVRYREAESAFDEDYAAALGMPTNRIDFGSGTFDTVEDFFEDLEKIAVAAKHPELYICDSLDALSDRGELSREIDDPTFGAEKAKKMSQLFRRLVRQLTGSQVTLIVVSQIRAVIGQRFGKKTDRSGGKSLNFYASQIVRLHQKALVNRTIKKIKRPVGIDVVAKMTKNKVGLPFREAQFMIRFGFGIDDLIASVNWLKLAGFLSDIGVKQGSVDDFIKQAAKLNDADYLEMCKEVGMAVEKRWYQIEQSFLPTRRKYG